MNFSITKTTRYLSPKYIIFATCFLILTTGVFGQKKSFAINGFIQTTAIKAENNDGFLFGFDRVRLASKGQLNPLVGFKLQVDFVKQNTDTDKDGDSPGIIKDAEIIFKANPQVAISVGKFKTPIGTEFNFSGSKLDFVKRGLGQALVFERNLGAMVRASKLGAMNLGFDVGVFNPGPNKANDIGSASEGQDYTFAGRVHASPVKNLTAEAYFGNATTSIAGQENVGIFGAGVKTKFDKLRVNGEFMSRDDGNSTAQDGTDFWVSASYLLNGNFEPAVKYEKLDVTKDASDQAITVVGVNFYFNAKDHHQSKIQVNYQSSDMTGNDAIQVMFQAKF
ncbi:MAG: hypothetical protein DWQ05_06835 [Calditrichaeota bacterium]|nr:MAG: hypothetical protein DWQ05_06835 [Calditrichota bacterium]